MDERQRKRRTLAMVAIMLSSVALAFVGGVAAQQGTPQPVENETNYYDNENTSVNSTGWVPGDGNATAGGMLEMIARVPGMFIGTGSVDPSGSGLEGVLLTGLVVGGAALFAVVGIGIGPIAGSMLGMVLAFGLTTVGFIPVWIQPLLLFTLVGVPAAAAILRVFNR